MTAAITRIGPTISPVAAASSMESTSHVSGIDGASQAGLSQSSGGNGTSGFETEHKRIRSFEEARRNHAQLNGLMTRVRKPLPSLARRMARAGLRAGSAGSMRGEYAYRNIFRPVDGRHYDMLVHPITNLLEWNFANLHADLPMQPYFYGSRGSAGRHAQLYGQPWQMPAHPQGATGHAALSWSHAVTAGATSGMQADAGFQFGALQYSPFRQGQFRYSQGDFPRLSQRPQQRNGLRMTRRPAALANDPAMEDDLPLAQSPAMSVRRSATQWREAVAQLQEGGMSAADMREWINDFHDCRRYPCVENHARFNEKYAGLFDGDIGDESLQAAFDGLRRAFGAALAPGQADAEPVPKPHARPD